MSEPPTTPSPADSPEYSEMRHRLANVFQLLSTLTRMRVQRSEDQEAKRQLSWLLDAMGALALLQKRPWNAGPGDFSLMLADMAPAWRLRCADRPIQLELDLSPLVVHDRHESALMLIAHELVVNAVAHGFPNEAAGLVRVRFGPTGDGAGELSVSDNGRGYDPLTVTKNRLGLWLISGLAAQVQGALTTTTDAGVHTRLVFPLPAAA